MNYIFDFDGTICDSFDLTLKIANEYLVKFKKKTIDPKEFKEEGIEEVIKDYKLNKLQVLLYIFKSRRELSKHIQKLKPFDGIDKIIKELSVSNHLGIVSSNSKKNIEMFLKQNNIANCFDFIYSSPTIFEKSKKISAAMKKYNLKKDETVYVGDEVRDIKAAKKVNLRVISVSWGFASKKLLQEFKPDFLIDKTKELIGVIKE